MNISILNTQFLEDLYNKYLTDPHSIDSSWHEYFKLLSNTAVEQNNHSTGDVIAHEMLLFYRQYGHINANLDPLQRQIVQKKLFAILPNQLVNLSDKSAFKLHNISMQDFHSMLENTYSNKIGFEIEHIENLEEKAWLYNKIESEGLIFDNKDKEEFLKTILHTKVFENYLHTKFIGAKRFSIEGGEVTILALQEAIKLSAANSIDEIIIGMAHRGRLSTLVQLIGKSPHILFAGFMGYAPKSEIPSFVGDVKYHLGYKNNIEINDKTIAISLAYNPSHLESVNSIVMGMVRAEQDRGKNTTSLLIHGDASFAGQGNVMESLAMSKLKAYDIGGVLHIIINNQIGFTTNPEQDRSTRYCSDIAKGFNIPIIHVCGNDPEAVIYAMRLAFEYKIYFKKDVIIDIICYRKYGHNEGDEPMFTQPSMYSQIHSKDFKDCVDLYEEKFTTIDVKALTKNYIEFLDSEYEFAKQLLAGTITPHNDKIDEDYQRHLEFEKKLYTAHNCTGDIGLSKLDNTDITELQSIITGVAIDKLKTIGNHLSITKDGFNLNNKIIRQFEARKAMMASGMKIDWGTGEALAFGSLLLDGYNIRFTGQDVERGTFSHRHAVLIDQITGEKIIPLNHLETQQKYKIFISNSFLSEFAVLGYEYGYANNASKCLTIWEAQFGDFANGAQVIIDQYISAAESKWSTLNNLVMLLPHGYEGQGPEHSSAKLERFLQICAQNNIQVCNCTTPASIFHLLRRQIMQASKKPLIIMTPKSLLRHKLAISNLSDMDIGTCFEPLIIESNIATADKIVFCSGKIFYDLYEHRQSIEAINTSIVRLEQLYPFPVAAVSKILENNKKAEIIWAQEEPQNMGAYSFIHPIFHSISSERKLKYAGRKRAASPATGFMSTHQSELENLLKDAI